MLNKKMGKGLVKAICLTAVLVLGLAPESRAEQFMGVNFPSGVSSFADQVVGYYPGSGVSSPYNIASNALGAPNNNYVSLGNFMNYHDGAMCLKFTNNYLTTSGNPNNDLWIFESGAQEPTHVYISKTGLNDWIDVGYADGAGDYAASAGIDLDAYTNNGVVLGEKYSYVYLVSFADFSGYPAAGADIDAVGAVSSVPVPEPATMLLLGSGLVGLAAAGKKRKNS